MRYGKVIACILTLVFLAAAVVIGTMDDPPEAEAEGLSLSLLISSEEGMETIFCWEQEPGRYYFFLPGYAELSEVSFRLDSRQEVTLNGKVLQSGMSCEDFPLDTPCELSVMENGQTTSGTVTFLRSGNVPSMYIDVRSGNMDYIHAEKGNKEPGTIRIYSAGGTLEHAGALESINGRGNATWENNPKKPYSLKLSTEADLLGLGTAQKWILMANGFDASNLRNKAVYDFADTIGLAYSPDCTWVDLYLNGEYAGLYLLSERNEIHPQRIDIAPTGSTLVSIDMQQRMERQGYPHIVVDGDTALRLHSGKKVTDEMTAFWKSVDNAIQASDGIDPVTGKSWLDFIDLDSWVRKYLIEEVFGNVEASAVSHYFYIDGDDETGKIYAGPVWDYDYALGSTRTWQTGTVQALFCARPYVWNETDTPWFYALWQKETFREQVIAVYETEFRPQMLSLLESGIEEYAARIAQASRLNRVRWAMDDATEEAASIKAYLTARLTFLDSLWLDGDTYYTVTANKTDGSVVSCFALKPGECVPHLPSGSGDTDVVGWYDYDTGEPFDITEPVYENKRIYLKREETPPAEEGTARLIIRYAPVIGLLVILLAACLLDRSRRKSVGNKTNQYLLYN